MMNICNNKRITLLFFLAILSIFFISFGKDKTKQLMNSMKGIPLNVNDQNVIRDIHFTCSEEVANLGLHQKVISYSFLNKDKGYWIGFNEVMQNISAFYPGWRVRIYASSSDISFLQSIMENWTFVNFCDIDNLPAPIYTLRPYPVTLWRFAPLGDDQVDVLLSRDLDSEILKREYDAVSEWLNLSNKSLHIMRDHPQHCVQILAGMWGIKIEKSLKRRRIKTLVQKMYEKGFNKTDIKVDQPYLKEILWPEFKKDFIAHDSFCCSKFKGSSPFPTRREKGKFVGAAIFRSKNPSGVKIPKKCPSICRPKNHMDWKYC